MPSHSERTRPHRADQERGGKGGGGGRHIQAARHAERSSADAAASLLHMNARFVSSQVAFRGSCVLESQLETSEAASSETTAL